MPSAEVCVTDRKNDTVGASHVETVQEESMVCYACGKTHDEGGWVGLCDRGCYYDMCSLLIEYESGRTDEPDPRIVHYFTDFPDGGGHSFNQDRILRYIAVLNGEEPALSEDEECTECYACGKMHDNNGWVGLCDRGCYYDLNALLYEYESGEVEEPDPRVVHYFTDFPDGGGHAFDPDRILKYIEEHK